MGMGTGTRLWTWLWLSGSTGLAYAVLPLSSTTLGSPMTLAPVFLTRDALEGKGPQRRAQKQLDRRLEEVAKAVGVRLLSVANTIEAGTCRQGDSS